MTCLRTLAVRCILGNGEKIYCCFLLSIVSFFSLEPMRIERMYSPWRFLQQPTLVQRYLSQISMPLFQIGRGTRGILSRGQRWEVTPELCTCIAIIMLWLVYLDALSHKECTINVSVKYQYKAIMIFYLEHLYWLIVFRIWHAYWRIIGMLLIYIITSYTVLYMYRKSVAVVLYWNIKQCASLWFNWARMGGTKRYNHNNNFIVVYCDCEKINQYNMSNTCIQ